jgi:26S proteasome regulatory subunit T2
MNFLLVVPTTRCRLRELRLERIKDHLIMEEEYIKAAEHSKVASDEANAERQKVDELRGVPMSVGSLEEIIDENHAIISCDGTGICFFTSFY